MATNKFTIYSSGDANGPGPITGTTGSLLPILDACLVNGYTGKPAAGWTKPFANSGSVYGAWTQGTGSGFTLFVNDLNAIVVNNSNGKEASIVGWEVLQQIGPSGTGSLHRGVGLNDFPNSSQGDGNSPSGRLVVRKSATSDTTPRAWIIAADAATLYMWIQAGDASSAYCHWAFGDCYSFAGAGDLWNCIAYGRVSDNTSDYNNYDHTAKIIVGPSHNSGGNSNQNEYGHYVARTAYGNGQSINFGKRGDSAVTYSIPGTTGPQLATINGVLQCPMGADGNYYMAPLEVCEYGTSPILRGRLRGLYHVGHQLSNFADGQLISGSNDYAGKIFMIVSHDALGSFWAVEVSPTLEFN